MKERFHAKPMSANTSLRVGVTLRGFLCVDSGNLSVTDADGTTLVAAVPVTAGGWTELPMMFRTSAGGTVTLAGGASGTLFL